MALTQATNIRSTVNRNSNAKAKLATKIGVSLLLGVFAFLLSQFLDAGAGPSLILGIGGSVFVSGVAFVTQFLIDVENQIDDVAERIEAVGEGLQKVEGRYEVHNRDTERMIKDEFANINKATELFSLVEASALKTDAVTQMVRNSVSVAQRTPPLIFDFAQAEISRLSGYLKDLGQGGDVTYEGEDRDWLLGLTRVATSTIDATSLSTVDVGGRGLIEGGLWSSDLGQQYLEAQREAIARGVVVRRIFIIDRPELEDDNDFVQILSEHAAIGVQVRTIKPDAVVTRRASLIDFIVVDSVLIYQSSPASRVPGRPPTIASTALITNGPRVAERIERYKALWTVAEPFSPRDR
jgi:hypothetical protein